MTPEKPEEILEDVGGEFGATVIYTLKYSHAVDFFVAEVTGREVDGNVPMYERKGASSSMDTTSNPREAARYFEGCVKWDGCSHVNFGDENAYLHLCGVESFRKLASIMAAVYARCGELMRARGVSVLEGEFPRDEETGP